MNKQTWNTGAEDSEMAHQWRVPLALTYSQSLDSNNELRHLISTCNSIFRRPDISLPSWAPTHMYI